MYLVPRYVVIAHMGLINNFLGLWIPYTANSFMILVLNNTFDHIPSDLYEAAQIDGASDLRMFTHITLPLLSSVLLVLGLFAFIGFWGDFLWPFLILHESRAPNYVGSVVYAHARISAQPLYGSLFYGDDSSEQQTGTPSTTPTAQAFPLVRIKNAESGTYLYEKNS